MSEVPILPSHESAIPAKDITHWLIRLGWNRVVVTDNFVFVVNSDDYSRLHVWCRDWVESQFSNRHCADHADHLEVTALMEGIALTAMKGATK